MSPLIATKRNGRVSSERVGTEQLGRVSTERVGAEQLQKYERCASKFATQNSA